jgi:hypothetical protein
VQTWIDDNSKLIGPASERNLSVTQRPGTPLEPVEGQCQFRPVRIHVSVELSEAERTTPFT